MPTTDWVCESGRHALTNGRRADRAARTGAASLRRSFLRLFVAADQVVAAFRTPIFVVRRPCRGRINSHSARVPARLSLGRRRIGCRMRMSLRRQHWPLSSFTRTQI